MAIIPVAKSIFICDRHVAYPSGKVDLIGIQSAIRPHNGYPYTAERFFIYAQLAGGLRDVGFYFNIRYAHTDEVIWTTQRRELTFPDRNSIVQLGMYVEGCWFARPGRYIVSLFFENEWIADTRLLLREA